MTTDLLVIERDARVAHPSYAKAGYVLLRPGATTFRSADFMRCDADAVVEWCRAQGCEIVPLVDPNPAHRRVRRVRFSDPALVEAFAVRFGAAARKT
ncbi:MAG TPA: hypothetical protein VHL98_04100 [Microvirga sp.]|jgi:hypothetical protein|nr:hypothetical protein [Microvirga sp.]